MYYFYILRGTKKDKIYIGSTSDIKRRLNEHNRGHTKSTRRFMPWCIVYLEKYLTRAEAIKRERQIKKWKNRKRIERLIERNI